jgi:hypothetical protein
MEGVIDRLQTKLSIRDDKKIAGETIKARLVNGESTCGRAQLGGDRRTVINMLQNSMEL